MKEMLNLVNEQIQTMINDGTIKQMINDRAANAVKDILDDSFRSYGTMRNSLKEKIEESLESSAFNFEIEPYTQTLNNFAQQQIAHYFEGEAREKLESSLSIIFKPVPGEMLLQELVTLIADAFRRDNYDNDRDEHLTMECEESEYCWFTLKFWKQKDGLYRENAPDIELHIGKDGNVRWLKGGNDYYGALNYGIEATLYRMAIKGTVITDIRACDQDEFQDTYIGIGKDYR